MIRRTALAGGLLAAAVALSACSSPSAPGSDAVAAANGVELSRSTLQQLVASPPPGEDAATTVVGDAADIRSVMTDWLRLAGTGVDMDGITTRQQLSEEADSAADELAATLVDDTADLYAQGWDVTPSVCLGLIPIAEGGDPQEVLDALESGTSFADAAKEFSAIPELAESGGVVALEEGVTCFDPGIVSGVITQQMVGALPGEPRRVLLDTGEAIIQIRPFDELSEDEQRTAARGLVGVTRAEQLSTADVFVDSRFGRWSRAGATVEALTAG